MRSALPTLIFLLPGLAQAQEETLLVEPPPRAIPAISVLVEGSILTDVMVPRYDRNRKLTSVLRSKVMTLETVDQIVGTTVSMELFNPDSTRRSRIDLAKALYDQQRGMLEANQPVTITSDRLIANGTGLVFEIEGNRGFLLGPATTRIFKPTATAMNSPSPALRATALLSAAILPLAAAPPAPIPPEQTAQIAQDSQSRAADVAAENKNARTDLRAILKASDDANKAATEFLEKADLLAAESPDPAPAPEAKPLEVPPDPEMTLITCDGGIFFDPANSVLIYLKNVVVEDPRFGIQGANELKVFFDKKEPAKPKEGDPPKKAPKSGDSISLSGSGDFGDPRRVVATGAVVLTQKAAPGEVPLKASGGTFSFDLLTGEKIISGNYPWFIQGDNFVRAEQPNLAIRIDKDFGINTDRGKWTTGMKLNQAADPNKPAPKR